MKILKTCVNSNLGGEVGMGKLIDNLENRKGLGESLKHDYDEESLPGPFLISSSQSCFSE